MKYKVIVLSIILFFTVNLSAKLTAVVSIEPQVTFVKQIAKDKINIELMVKNGASVHNYSPKPSQMKSITKAKLYFAIGVEFEHIWLDKFKKINNNINIVYTDKNIKKLTMIEHHEHNNEHIKEDDPHIWTSPSNVKIIAKNVLNALIEYDNKNKDFYTNNYNEFVNTINYTNKKIENLFINLPKKTKFMVFHPSWGYFAKEYDLIQVAIEVEGKNPKPKALRKLILDAKKNNIKAIFVSPNSSNKIAKIIANELNINLIKVSTLNKNWSNNLIFIAKEIINKDK